MAIAPKAVIWVVSLIGGNYFARLHLVEKTGLDSTEVMFAASSLDALVGMAPDGLKRIPKLPTQAATVVENWI